MTWQLARPSFWPEPRDPWVWQRALRKIAASEPAPDPWPCWEQVLRGTLSRRSVSGLYGLRARPAPAMVLGIGLLRWEEAGWSLEPIGQELAALDREMFQVSLARQLVQRSAWLRLALRELAAGRWTMPRGTAPLAGRRQIRVGEDLVVSSDALADLPEPTVLLGDLHTAQVDEIKARVAPAALSALHAPLYLLRALGWIDDSGCPTLPDALAASLGLETPASTLRRISAEEQDPAGFVPVARVARRLAESVGANGAVQDLAAWTDAVIGSAIEAGMIEVHAWAPGQPRHGRGLYGDRDRKLARWTIHDDFKLPAAQARGTGEADA